jgi:hypothetical protein
MTPSEVRKALANLETQDPNQVVQRDYDGAGQLLVEPAVEEPLWPSCDQVLADWYGIDPEDVAEFMTEVNWRTNDREED